MELGQVVKGVSRRTQLLYRENLADHADVILALTDPSEFRDLWTEVSAVLTWDRRPTARRLWEFARLPDRGAIVEIGSYLGNSTIYLARGGGQVHAVDPHSDESMRQVPERGDISAGFLANLERFGVRERVVYHRASSVEAAQFWSGEGIRLLFVDGLHTFAAVQADYLAWRPFLAGEHVVLFDDYLWREVQEAVDDIRRRYPPNHFYSRGGQAIFSTRPLPIRIAGLP